jgi:hypothetical protein
MVLTAMSYQHSSPGAWQCSNRQFVGVTPSHEVMYSASGGICTRNNAPLDAAEAFLGTFRFLVR